MTIHAPEQWEYMSFHVEFGQESRSLDQRLNQLGAAGWELVSTSPLSLGGRMMRGSGNTNALFFVLKRRRGTT